MEFCVLEFCAIVMQLIGLLVESGIGNGSFENAIIETYRREPRLELV